MQQTAILIGASGLIGSHIVSQLLDDNSFSRVRLLVRRKLPFEHAKLEQVVLDLNDEGAYREALGNGDCIFSCIGTTQKNVGGDNALYKKIDHDIPLNAARAGIENGFKKFLIVSSVGANASSSTFYLALKGRIEEDLKALPFDSLCLFRPSMILGKRGERRPLEKVMQGVTRMLAFLFLGPLRPYHPVKARDVAAAMIAASKLAPTGIRIFEYREMMQLIGDPRRQ